MSTQQRAVLEASRREAGLPAVSDPPPTQRVEATILLRRRPDSGAEQRMESVLRGEAPPVSREDAALVLGADPADLEHAAAFAASYGLTMTDLSAAKREVRVAGTVQQMETAFGVKLYLCGTGGRSYLCYNGVLTIPASLDQVIVGVLGLDQRPVARARG